MLLSACRDPSSKPSTFLVGAGRFELPTPCSRSKCATRLRYAPPRTRRNSAHETYFAIRENVVRTARDARVQVAAARCRAYSRRRALPQAPSGGTRRWSKRRSRPDAAGRPIGLPACVGLAAGEQAQSSPDADTEFSRRDCPRPHQSATSSLPSSPRGSWRTRMPSEATRRVPGSTGSVAAQPRSTNDTSTSSPPPNDRWRERARP